MTDVDLTIDFRKAHKLTQAAAAAIIGYGDGRTIRRIEAGDQPLSSTARMAMKYYNQLAFIAEASKG